MTGSAVSQGIFRRLRKRPDDPNEQFGPLIGSRKLPVRRRQENDQVEPEAESLAAQDEGVRAQLWVDCLGGLAFTDNRREGFRFCLKYVGNLRHRFWIAPRCHARLEEQGTALVFCCVEQVCTQRNEPVGRGGVFVAHKARHPLRRYVVDGGKEEVAFAWPATIDSTRRESRKASDVRHPSCFETRFTEDPDGRRQESLSHLLGSGRTFVPLKRIASELPFGRGGHATFTVARCVASCPRACTRYQTGRQRRRSADGRMPPGENTFSEISGNYWCSYDSQCGQLAWQSIHSSEIVIVNSGLVLHVNGINVEGINVEGINRPRWHLYNDLTRVQIYAVSPVSFRSAFGPTASSSWAIPEPRIASVVDRRFVR